MSVVLSAVISFLLFFTGMLGFIALPYFASSIPDSYAPLRRAIARFYLGLVGTALYRGVLVPRRHSGVALVATEFNTEVGTERAELDGETEDFTDHGSRLNWLAGRSFGIALERWNAIVDPVDVAIGAKRADLLDAGASRKDFEGIGEAIAEHVHLPDAAPLVDFDKAKHVLGGSGEPEDVEVTEEHVIRSQNPHATHNVIEMMTWVGIFAGTLVLMYLAFDFASSMSDSGGGVADAIPIMIGVMG